ncbi:MAG: hypothetical protein LC620_08425, partial [Halobacteriales archaeon]|nr:hypothetical protein [Halobacteriales archaeon]
MESVEEMSEAWAAVLLGQRALARDTVQAEESLEHAQQVDQLAEGGVEELSHEHGDEEIALLGRRSTGGGSPLVHGKSVDEVPDALKAKAELVKAPVLVGAPSVDSEVLSQAPSFDAGLARKAEYIRGNHKRGGAVVHLFASTTMRGRCSAIHSSNHGAASWPAVLNEGFQPRPSREVLDEFADALQAEFGLVAEEAVVGGPAALLEQVAERPRFQTALTRKLESLGRECMFGRAAVHSFPSARIEWRSSAIHSSKSHRRSERGRAQKEFRVKA